MVQASSREGDWVMDFFAGSGTLGAVAAETGRRFILVDKSAEALAVMENRLQQNLFGETRFIRQDVPVLQGAVS